MQQGDKFTENWQGLIDWLPYLPYKYILALRAMNAQLAISQQLAYIEWIIRWYQKSTLQSFTMSLHKVYS